MASEKSLNILFLADHNSIHDKKWITWIAENTGHKCFLISREKHGNMQENWTNVEFLGNIPDFSVTQGWKNRKGKAILDKIIQEKGINLAHLYYAEPNALWAIHLSKKGIPVGVTTRGSDVLVGLNHFLERRDILANLLIRKYRKALQACSFIISTSHTQKDRIDRFFLGKDFVDVIRTGIDAEAMMSIRSKNLAKKKQIFFGRNMQPLYNHHFVLDNLDSLPEEIKRDYEFIFIEKDGENREYIEFIQDKIDNLSNLKIRFLNKQKGEEYYTLIAESMVNVMTPLSDGAPVSGIETLALNTNLVLPDLIYDEDLYSSAQYYEQHNGEDFIDTLQAALDSPVIIDNSYIEETDRNFQMQKVADIYNEVAG